MAPYLSKTDLEQAMEIALNLDDSIGELIYQPDALSALAPYLPQSQLRGMIDNELRYRDEYMKARVIVNSVPQLIEEDPIFALKLLERVILYRDHAWYDSVSAVLAKIVQLGQPELALETAQYRFYGDEKAFSLACLVPELPASLQSEARSVLDVFIEEHITPYTENASGLTLKGLELLDVNRETRAALLPFLDDDQAQIVVFSILYQWEPADGPTLISRMAKGLSGAQRSLSSMAP